VVEMAKMKTKDDSKLVKQKDDRKPVSFEAQKSCRKLGCFFCPNEKEDKLEK
jgi:hypothetical protein